MNEFNVLLAAATNGTPSGSLFDALFARYIAPQESWRELESPLPITILAAGEDLIDYRIYGNTVGGESVGERTGNLLDVSQIERIGSLYQSGKYVLACDENTTYTFSSSKVMQSIFVYGNSDYSSDRIVVAYSTMSVSFSTGARSTIYLRFDLNRTSDDYRTSELMLIEGSTAPASYIPFGYKLPMVVTNGTATTTTPIYIGSDPLAEDEYVDFGEQKIYRMEGGTLTPTDPPAPIPALPTIEGETIIDYNPSETTAVEPEKMYMKYKPQ